MIETRTQNNLAGPSYDLKKSDWLKYCPPPNAEILLVDNVENLLVETTMAKNLICRNPEQLRTTISTKIEILMFCIRNVF